jgi:hypothetical protein
LDDVMSAFDPKRTFVGSPAVSGCLVLSLLVLVNGSRCDVR